MMDILSSESITAIFLSEYYLQVADKAKVLAWFF